MVPDGTRSKRGCSGREKIQDTGEEFSLRDKEGQRFLWVRSKGENQETKPHEEGEEGAGGSMFSGKEQGSSPFVKSICIFNNANY